MAFVTPAAHADISSDGVVKAANGQLVAVLLTAAAATATVTLYDNASAASGTVLAKLSCVANTSAQFNPSPAPVFTNGCYADISGAGANATVVYI